MSSKLAKRIQERQAQLKSAGLLRCRQLDATNTYATHVDDTNVSLNNTSHDAVCSNLINFASNDYLGLAKAPALIEALYQGAKYYGVGSGASPLVTGYLTPHKALEDKLCELTGHEAGLLFCSGFSANQALIHTLFNDSDVLLADKLIHASVIDGINSSKAQLKRFIHNDIDSANRLSSHCQPQAIMTESVFSMDGDIAPLNALSELARSYDALFIVDDAHGFGIIGDNGRGATEYTSGINVQLVTFGKALGCQGAAILGSRALIDYLVANARHYIYSTALSPALAHVALAAIELSDNSPQLRDNLVSNIRLFKRLCAEVNLPLQSSNTPIQPVIVGNSQKCLSIAAKLKQNGVFVAAIRPPTVPQGSARLRVTLSAIHTESEVRQLVALLNQLCSTESEF